jgi:hypothetical protein
MLQIVARTQAFNKRYFTFSELFFEKTSKMLVKSDHVVIRGLCSSFA